jgi:hypothetical protein
MSTQDNIYLNVSETYDSVKYTFGRYVPVEYIDSEPKSFLWMSLNSWLDIEKARTAGKEYAENYWERGTEWFVLRLHDFKEIQSQEIYRVGGDDI